VGEVARAGFRTDSEWAERGSVLSRARSYEESVGLSVFWLAIRKAGQAAESPPIRCTWIGLIPAGQFLGDKRGDSGFVGPVMLQPGLKVT
jgi:hypothetical protein